MAKVCIQWRLTMKVNEKQTICGYNDSSEESRNEKPETHEHKWSNYVIRFRDSKCQKHYFYYVFCKI